MEPDELIVGRVLAGDKAAFGLLIDRHRPEAVRLARRVLWSSAEAEDAVQEAWLQAFLSLPRLETASRFRGWLLGIVVNIARSQRRRRRDASLEDWAGGRAVDDPALRDAEPLPDVVQESRELHRIVVAAIGELAPEQRAAVELHYVDGLKLWEIAALSNAPVGTVKARLHRARARLRQALATAVAASPWEIGDKEEPMVKVTVQDVIVRAPKEGEVHWLAQGKENRLAHWRVILLRERSGTRVLPIWVDPRDGDIIAMRLAGLASFRPMPWDLITRLIEIGEMTVERVAVTSLRDNTFYGSLWIRAAGKVHELDVRPSDAINIALDTRAPIFVTEETFAQAGAKVLTASQELPGLEAIHHQSVAQGKAEPDPDEREWRSFRSLPRKEAPWIRTVAR